MRNLSLLILITLSFQFAFGQRTTSKNFNKKVEILPEFPVENLRNVAFKFYYPYKTITQDTLRKYVGNMRILGNEIGYIPLGGPKYKSLHPLKMVEENWDMLVEVAFEDLGLKKKSLGIDTIETVFGEQSVYYYNVIHAMPTVVKISDRNGKIIDMWSLPTENHVRFDRKYEDEYSENGDTIKITNNNYFSEEELKNAWNKKGRAKVNRLSFLTRISRILDQLYPKIYFSEGKDKWQIKTGKHKKHDYSELDKAQKDAIEKLEDDRLDELTENIVIWEKYLEQYDKMNVKAKINDAVAVGLHRNLAIAYLYQEDFEKAVHHAKMSNKPIREGSFTMEVYGPRKEKNLLPIIESRARAFESNGHIERPEKLNRFFNFKKEIGKRGRNWKYDLISHQNRIGEFYNAWLERQPKVTIEETTITALDKYLHQIQQPGSKYETLVLNYLDNGDIAGGVLPSEITELKKLHSLQAGNMNFTEVPESIGNMENLTLLGLRANNLTSLPSSIGNLTKLKTLNLAKNKLTTLPESIKNCKKLKKVVLKGNPISSEEMKKIKSWLPKKCKVK